MISQEHLKSILHYDPETGIWTWLVDQKANKLKNKTFIRNKYIRIQVDYKSYYAHRLAFLYMTGKFPEKDVDHINRIKDDNRWINLREANRSQNKGNIDIPKNNTSGHKGVTYRKEENLWTSSIMVEGSRKYLGYFPTKELAAKAYNKAALEYFGEFAVIKEVNING